MTSPTAHAWTGVALPLTMNGSSSVVSNGVPTCVQHVRGREDLTRGGLRHQPSGQVHGIAHHRVRPPVPRADVAGEHAPRGSRRCGSGSRAARRRSARSASSIRSSSLPVMLRRTRRSGSACRRRRPTSDAQEADAVLVARRPACRATSSVERRGDRVRALALDQLVGPVEAQERRSRPVRCSGVAAVPRARARAPRATGTAPRACRIGRYAGSTGPTCRTPGARAQQQARALRRRRCTAAAARRGLGAQQDLARARRHAPSPPSRGRPGPSRRALGASPPTRKKWYVPVCTPTDIRSCRCDAARQLDPADIPQRAAHPDRRRGRRARRAPPPRTARAGRRRRTSAGSRRSRRRPRADR